ANPALAVTVCWTRSNNVFLASFFGGHARLYRILFVLRGETDIDSRPNKALEIRSHRPEWASYQYKSEWEKVVRYRFIPEWKTNFAREVSPPLNHSSTSTAMKSILRSIRKGQDKNQSVNDNTIGDGSIGIQYDGPQALARRILQMETECPGLAKLMSGDVRDAFHNVPVHADQVGRFAGVIRELNNLVIDLACPFGWSAKYWLAGGAITHIYANSKPSWPSQPTQAAQSFDAKTWYGDHNAIEADIDTRLFEANLALREAMFAVLGLESINEDKFTIWASTGKALGLQ
ncbi:hypothetical protein JG688_00016338, partial [Phytophthora aleatoria]